MFSSFSVTFSFSKNPDALALLNSSRVGFLPLTASKYSNHSCFSIIISPNDQIEVKTDYLIAFSPHCSPT